MRDDTQSAARDIWASTGVLGYRSSSARSLKLRLIANLLGLIFVSSFVPVSSDVGNWLSSVVGFRGASSSRRTALLRNHLIASLDASSEDTAKKRARALRKRKAASQRTSSDKSSQSLLSDGIGSQGLDDSKPASIASHTHATGPINTLESFAEGANVRSVDYPQIKNGDTPVDLEKKATTRLWPSAPKSNDPVALSRAESSTVDGQLSAAFAEQIFDAVDLNLPTGAQPVSSGVPVRPSPFESGARKEGVPADVAKLVAAVAKRKQKAKKSQSRFKEDQKKKARSAVGDSKEELGAVHLSAEEKQRIWIAERLRHIAAACHQLSESMGLNLEIEEPQQSAETHCADADAADGECSGWKFVKSTADKPAGCMVFLEAPVGRVVGGPRPTSVQQADRLVAFSVINKLRRTEPEKLKELWYSQFDPNFEPIIERLPTPVLLLSALIDSPWILRTAAGAAVAHQVYGYRYKITKKMVWLLLSRKFWRNYRSWKRIIAAPLPLRLLMARGLVSALALFGGQLETGVREVMVELESKAIERYLPTE
eukprot:Selendium_serpulae@DN4622_c0_g1_i2.p1